MTKAKRHITRQIYKTQWECLFPGCWRSECGWYIAKRVGKSDWIGKDLSDAKVTHYGSCLTSIVWHFLPKEAKDYFCGKAKASDE